MMNENVLRGSWHEIRGKICSRWGQISDDDLTAFSGNVEELIGEIQRKTGESQEAIRNYLNEITQEGAGTVGRFTEQAGRYVGQAAASVQGATRNFADNLATSYGGAERMVQQRPAESLAVAFGLGLITGTILGMFMNSR